MNPEQLNRAKQRKRLRDAKLRVKAWERWRRHGYARAYRPEVLPTDKDIKLVRGTR